MPLDNNLITDFPHVSASQNVKFVASPTRLTSCLSRSAAAVLLLRLSSDSSSSSIYTARAGADALAHTANGLRRSDAPIGPLKGLLSLALGTRKVGMLCCKWKYSEARVVWALSFCDCPHPSAVIYSGDSRQILCTKVVWCRGHSGCWPRPTSDVLVIRRRLGW